MRERLDGMPPMEYFGHYGPMTVTGQYEQPDWIRWDEEAYRGDAYATYGWGL